MQHSALRFRPATRADLDRSMVIIDEAKRQMLREGKHQWTDGYPARTDLAADIEAANGWVLTTAEGLIVAYGAVVFTGEPAYNYIEGAWLTEAQYVVVHRLAVADEVKCQGVAGEFLRRVAELARERGCGAFRIDTNYDNDRMQHILTREGFRYCGEIFYPKGARMAYERAL